ncbi:MAG TPA: glycosyltransferase [Anaerolineaceae bacterium]|nr:glycosyltransferase [Anaerolineaceae bacterium]
MKTVLLLLNESYPYRKPSEAFLEPELKIAAQYFDQILILPSAQGMDTKDGREIHLKNVHVSPVKRESLFVEFIKSFLYILRHKGFWQDICLFSKKGLLFRASAWRKLIYGLLTEAAIVRQLKSIAGQIDEQAIVIAYSYWLFGEAGGAIAVKKILKNQRTLSIARGHGTDIAGYASLQGYSPLLKYYLEGLDGVFPISTTGGTRLQAQYEKYGAKSRSIGAKIHPFHLGIEDWREQEILPGGASDPFTILSCSAVVPVKRVHLIVEALAQIKSKKIRWVHLGDGELMGAVSDLCRNKLGENVRYELKGAVPHSSVREFLRTNEVNLFVNVSASEGIPVSMMEAFLFGIPAIATDVGGTSELCRDGINGFLVAKDFDSKDLARRIEKMVDLTKNDVEAYLQLRRAARQTVTEEFSIENHRRFYAYIRGMAQGGVG